MMEELAAIAMGVVVDFIISCVFGWQYGMALAVFVFLIAVTTL